MKRFVYAAAAVLLTGVLVLLAMAVAQRDSRVSDATTDESQLPYANNAAEPIAMAPSDIAAAYGSQSAWPPAPIVRSNGSELNDRFPSSENASLPSDQETSNDLRSATVPVALAAFANDPPQSDLQTAPQELAEPPALIDTNPFPPSMAAPYKSANATTDLLPPNSLPNLPSNSLPHLPNGFSDEPSRPATSLPAELSASPFASPPSISDSAPTSVPQSLPPSIATLGAPTLLGSGPSLPPMAAPAAKPLSGSSFPESPMINSGMPSGGTIANNSLSSSDALRPTQLPSNQLPSNPSSFSSSASNALADEGLSSDSSPQSNWFSSAAPGGRQLDGSQNPSMEIQKRAPSEVQVGQPATFTIMVRNVGTATAYDVNVVDSVPKGAKLVRTNPQAQVNGSNGLVWKLGEMPAGSDKVLTLELIPETEGEIGSVASVTFAAQASVRTMSTQPKLVVKQLLEPLVLGGDSLRIMIEIANVGTGTARDVRLQEDVPENMRHATGSRALELNLGDLAPGESEKRDIELTAVSAGKVRNVIRALSENAATGESSADIEVVLPKLDVAIEGASLRYLERQVTYTLHVANSGTAIAKNVELLLYLPSGLQFNSTINEGAYLPSQHAVRWELAELAAGAKATTEVTLLPVEEGSFMLRMQSAADGIQAETAQKPVRVEGQSELTFSIEDDNDPIETDGKTTYIVKISNIGTRVDKNVELAIDLPEGAIVEQIDAPVDYKASQRNIVFAPIAQIKAKDRFAIRFSVRHTREGTHVVRAQLKSQLRPVVVSKEESTQVYIDR